MCCLCCIFVSAQALALSRAPAFLFIKFKADLNRSSMEFLKNGCNFFSFSDLGSWHSERLARLGLQGSSFVFLLSWDLQSLLRTTLLNYILDANHGKKIAIIENEFGEA